MRSYIAVLGMVAAAAAQTTGFHAINLPGMNENVPACSTYMVKWTPSTDASMAGPVTFGLIGGATQQTLIPIGDTFGSVDGSVGQYAWDVPCDAGADAIYGLKIFLVSNMNTFQYSMPFHIIPVDSSSSSSSSSTASSTNTAATSTKAPTSTKTGDSEPTGFHGGHNSTMTTIEPPVTTSCTNGTVITHKPTGTGTIVTSFTTKGSSTGTGTGAAATTAVTAGASRAVSGSFAILAVAAAFFSL